MTCQFPDQRVTDSALRDRAAATLRRIRNLASPIIAPRAAEMWAALPADSKTGAERDAARADPTLDWRLATQDGRFAAFLDCRAIAILVGHDPGAFLDGVVFAAAVAGLTLRPETGRSPGDPAPGTVGEFVADPGRKSQWN